MRNKLGTGRGLAPRTKELAVYLFIILFGVAILVALTGGRLDIAGWMMLAFSLLWLGWDAWCLAAGLQSRDWPSTRGTIVDAQVWQYRSAKYGTRIYAPCLTYRYSVTGQTYPGRPVVFGKTGRPEKILRPYPPGQAITVYYDPRHPERSRLRRGNNRGDYARLLLPLAILAVGVAMICI